MTKFVLLFTDGNTPETEAEEVAVMKAWTDWYTTLANAVVDAGDPFTDSAKRIASTGTGTVTQLHGSTMATGYTIVEAGSLDQAAKMAQGCPILHAGGEVSVYETFAVM